ncbi:hypothetical protein ACH36K_11750 [Clostridium sp. MB05]
MNKKLFLKLGLLLLSLSLVACGQKNNSSGEDNSSKSSTSQLVSSTQSSVKESVKTTSPSVENAVESKQEDVQKNTQQDTKPDTQPEATEKKYYDLIKEAWQKQKDYIDSIDDPKVKQSVQTTHSAAILKSNELLLAHPEDSKAINASLKRVLAGE